MVFGLWFQRQRSLPYEKNKNLYELARRVAINTPVQGTAAEITKMGMIQFYKEAMEHRLEAKILLQIHDELIYEIADDILDEVSKKVKEIMQDVLPIEKSFEVPIITNFSSGQNWGELR